MPDRNGDPLDLALLGGHYAEGCWYKLASGQYPGGQGAQRDALLADLGITLPDNEWDWIEASYQRALDKFWWVYALGRLSAYNEGRSSYGTPTTNAEAKTWMQDAETRQYSVAQ